MFLGFEHIMKALFGEQVKKITVSSYELNLNFKYTLFQSIPGSNGKLPHPLTIADTLETQSDRTHNITFSTLGLIKFLLYGDYLKVKASSGRTSMKAIIYEDLKRYGYKAKESFEVMVFLGM